MSKYKCNICKETFGRLAHQAQWNRSVCNACCNKPECPCKRKEK